MVILRAPPGSTIENLERNNAGFVLNAFDNIASKPPGESRQQLQLLINSRQSHQFKNQQKLIHEKNNDAPKNSDRNMVI